LPCGEKRGQQLLRQATSSEEESKKKRDNRSFFYPDFEGGKQDVPEQPVNQKKN